MEIKNAVRALGALSHDARLRAFRLLVEAGDGGMAAGDIAARLGVPNNTLSFHLKELSDAGLVRSTREGRSVLYALDVGGVGALMGFLMEDCCGGKPELCVTGARGRCAPGKS